MKVSRRKRYRVHEFARLGGVTVRVLHSYDRLGLLKPLGRSHTGYRQYTGKDFVTLKQIAALELFGFTAEEIKRLITGANLAVVRTILEQKQHQLNHVIQAVREAEELPLSGQDAGQPALRTSWLKFLLIEYNLQIDERKIDATDGHE